MRSRSAGWWRWCMVQHITAPQATTIFFPSLTVWVCWRILWYESVLITLRLFMPSVHSSSAFRENRQACLDSLHKAAPKYETWTFLFSVNTVGVNISSHGGWGFGFKHKCLNAAVFLIRAFSFLFFSKRKEVWETKNFEMKLELVSFWPMLTMCCHADVMCSSLLWRDVHKLVQSLFHHERKKIRCKSYCKNYKLIFVIHYSTIKSSNWMNMDTANRWRQLGLLF